MLLFEYLGLFIGYVILVTLALWIIVRVANLPIFVKICFVPILIWYGLFMWYTPQSILGYPTTQLPPNGSIIYSYSVHEPGPREKNPGIYLWVIAKENTQARNGAGFWSKFNPKKVFKKDRKDILRSYVLPYSVGMHKELRKVAQRAARSHGYLIFRRATNDTNRTSSSSNGQRGVDKRQNPKGKFDVINPGDNHELKDYEKHYLQENN